MGHEVGDRLVTDLLAVGGGVELLLVPLRGVGVHIADEALVEHQALQQALGRARADDDAVVQRGHHDGARVQPVYGAHCLDLRTDRDICVRQQKNVRLVLRMELYADADRLQSSCWGSLTGEALQLGKTGATSVLLHRVYNKMSALRKEIPSLAPCVLPVHSKDNLKAFM